MDICRKVKMVIDKRIFLLFGALSFCALSYIYFPESIDDAYITLRFSKNFLLGNGPIFNVGERVEGYSNFLWMAIISIFGRLGIPMEMAMKFLSLACGVVCLFLVWRFSAKTFKGDAPIISATVILGLSSFFSLWSVDGLETMFYTMLLTALVYLLAAERTRSVVIGVIAGAVAVTRPEGVMYSMIAVCWLAIRKGIYAGRDALIPVVVCAGGYELFRLLYFHEMLSNTASAKLHIGVDAAISGIKYIIGYNSASGYLILPAMLIGATAIWAKPTLVLPAAFVLAQAVFVLISGGDFMYGYRFIVPVMPCIAVLVGATIDMIGVRFNQRIALAALAVIAVDQLFCQYIALPKKHVGTDNLIYRSAPHFGIARFLSKNTSASDWVLLSEAGIIPYYINARIIDYLGLTSPYNSVYRADGKIDSKYIFSFHPKFVIISFVQGRDDAIRPRLLVEANILKYPEFKDRYRKVRRFDIPKGKSFLDDIYYRYAPDAKDIFFRVYERSQ